MSKPPRGTLKPFAKALWQTVLSVPATLLICACPHQMDAEDPRLYGTWKAATTGQTILGSSTIVISRPNLIRLSNGKTHTFYRSDNSEISIDVAPSGDFHYSQDGDSLILEPSMGARVRYTRMP